MWISRKAVPQLAVADTVRGGLLDGGRVVDGDSDLAPEDKPIQMLPERIPGTIAVGTLP